MEPTESVFGFTDVDVRNCRPLLQTTLLSDGSADYFDGTNSRFLYAGPSIQAPVHIMPMSGFFGAIQPLLRMVTPKHVQLQIYAGKNYQPGVDRPIWEHLYKKSELTVAIEQFLQGAQPTDTVRLWRESNDSIPQAEKTPQQEKAENAFGIGFFVGAASAYKGFDNKYFSPFERIVIAGVGGLIVGSIAYFVTKGKKEVAVQPIVVQPRTPKARTHSSRLVWFVAVPWLVGIIWLVGKNLETKPVQANPNSSAAPQVENPKNSVNDQSQTAAVFERDFFNKYPDLRAQRGVVDAVANRLAAAGYKGENREAVMEKFATEARKQIATVEQENFWKDFFEKYPSLQSSEQLVYSVAKRLNDNGYKRESREADMRKLASEVQRIIQNGGN
ncbi:MAG: hypothetical protein WCH99_14580 [Verrucomicrobiota bacterium]